MNELDPEEAVLFVNVYGSSEHDCYVHPSKEQADENAAPYRTACLKITHRGGKFISAVPV